MDLKQMAVPGDTLVALLSENDRGRTFYCAVVGTMRVTEDGHAFLETEKGEWEAWEIHYAAKPETSELGADLAEVAAKHLNMLDADSAVRAVLAAHMDEDEGYGLNQYAIFKGVYIDTPSLSGFRDRDGVYLIAPGTNSAYGNFRGGFPNEEAATAYAAKHNLGPEWKPVRRGPAPEPEADEPSAGPRM